MEKSLIVAVADNLAIGKNNDLLFHIHEDMRYFRRTTTGSPVIMGFMTFKSLGSKPLPKRKNIVISLFPWPDAPEGITVVKSLEEAYGEAAKDDPEKCFVIGGGQTYAEAMKYSDTMYITHVHAVVPDATVYFPRIDPAVWKVVSTTPRATDPDTGLEYEFTVYGRK
jgi:dihydrofolate reductase